MKTTFKYLLVLALASFVLVDCTTNRCGSCKMAQREYKTVRLAVASGNLETELNQVAKDGWKLFTITPDSSGYSYFIFERPKQ
jgi:hypothetical protein